MNQLTFLALIINIRRKFNSWILYETLARTLSLQQWASRGRASKVSLCYDSTFVNTIDFLIFTSLLFFSWNRMSSVTQQNQIKMFSSWSQINEDVYTHKKKSTNRRGSNQSMRQWHRAKHGKNCWKSAEKSIVIGYATRSVSVCNMLGENKRVQRLAWSHWRVRQWLI